MHFQAPQLQDPTDKSSGLAPRPLPLDPLCPEAPSPGACPESRRVRVNNVSHVGVTLTVCLVTSTPLVVPSHYVGSPSQSPWSLWEGTGVIPILFAEGVASFSWGPAPFLFLSSRPENWLSLTEPGRGSSPVY